jgi:hypothetical protein
VVALGFAIVLGVPFALGCVAMALPLRRLGKVAIALAPLAALALALVEHSFWLGDIGGLAIAVIATWAWLLGTAASSDLRSLTRLVVRLARA